MKKKTLIRTLVPTIAAASFLGLAFMNKGRASSPAYQTEILARGDIESVVSTSGTLAAVETVDVGSQVSGKIIKLYADYNSEVKAGQVLAELDQEILKARVETREANDAGQRAALEQARTELEMARRKFERSANLYANRLVSAEDNETAEAAFVAARTAVRVAEGDAAQAKSTLDSSRIDLSYAVVRAPIAGTVINRSVNIGQTVAASYEAPVLFKIASDLKTMQVQCSVDEAEIGRVKEGQEARFTVGAYPDEAFTGIVRQVRNSSATNSNVVTYTAIIDTKNPDRALKPGMTASVSIVAAKARGVLRISAAALSFKPSSLAADVERLYADLRRSIKPGVAVVWRLNPKGALEPVRIGLGITDKTVYEIASGDVQAGQKIVTGFQTGAASATQPAMDVPPPPPDGMMPPPPLK